MSAWLAPLVVRFGRSAAQIFQNGLRQLGLLGCPPCSPSAGPFRPLSSPNPSKRTSPACYAWLCSLLPLVVRFCRTAAQILQDGPRQLGEVGCAPCSGMFWPLSSPNPPNRTSPACDAWRCSLLPLVVRFCRSAAQILQNGPRQLGEVGCAPCSGLFWPLSSPNPPKRTSPASSAWLCSLLSLWWSVLAAQQRQSFKTDLATFLCFAVLLALPLVVRFGRLKPTFIHVDSVCPTCLNQV